MEVNCYEDKKAMSVRRWFESDEVFILYNFSDGVLELPLPEGTWEKLLESSSEKWGGNGGIADDRIKSFSETKVNLNPQTFVLYKVRK